MSVGVVSPDAVQRLLRALTALGEEAGDEVPALLLQHTGARRVVVGQCEGLARVVLSRWGPAESARQPEVRALHGSPHAKVLKTGRYACIRGLQERFPQDACAREVAAQAYVGVAFGEVSTSCGVLGLYYDEPLTHARKVARLLSVAALRVHADLRYQRARAHGPGDGAQHGGLEAKLQHAQKLESLALLAGGIAHDFNNLLVGILGNVALALSELDEESPLLPVLEDAQGSARRAAELTKQMLAYSGRGRFVLSYVDLNTLLEETRGLLHSAMPKTARLELDLAEELPTVRADPGQLRQVIVNLVSNAADALGENSGRISVRTSTHEADSEYLASSYYDDSLPAGRYVCLEVTDTGAGMDAATTAKIFDPFFTTKFTGRGLGLAAVLGIVRGHHGAVRVDSAVGRGSSFRLLFPAADAPARVASPSEPPESGTFTGTGYILIADDEETVRNVAQRVLTQRGHRVLVAEDGIDAVEKFRAHAGAIMLVLLDLTMPGIGGEQVFRELTRIQPGVPVILTSGYSEQDVTASFASEGLAGFLQKPWGPDELLGSLRRVLGS